MSGFNFQLHQFSGDTRYLYSVGRLRVMEKQLIPFQKFNRMADRENWQGVLDELRSTTYYERLIPVKNARMLEDAISSFLQERQRLIWELSLNSPLVKALLMRHDFNNLKILLKEQWLSRQRAFPLSTLGIVEPGQLEEQFRQPHTLPPPLQDALQIATNDFQQHQSVFRGEMVVDLHYLEYVKSQFLRSNLPFLKEFIAYRIDWLNVAQLLRWRWWQPDSPPDWQLFVPGGYLNMDFLHRLWKEPPERLPELIRFTHYGEVMAEGMEHYRQHKQLWKLEKLGEDFITAFCRLTRYASAGIEPLIAFIWVSMQELKNLHMILIAKYMGLSPEIIKTRIRMVYE